MTALNVIEQILDSREILVSQTTGKKINKFTLLGSNEVYDALCYIYIILLYMSGESINEPED